MTMPPINATRNGCLLLFGSSCGAAAREFGCAAEALYFHVPLEICLKRNRKRENLRAGPGRDARVVPEDVLRRMARRIEPPTREEGFSRIVVVRSGAKKSRRRAKLE